MGQITYLLILYMIFTFIDPSYSAIYWTFGVLKNAADDYRSSRSESAHRGILLSYSADEKNQICKDLFFSVYHKPIQPSTVKGPTSSNLQITDALEIEGRISVSKIIAIGQSDTDDEDIFFKCVGLKISADGTEDYCFISSAFQSGLMYASIEAKNGDKSSLDMMAYIAISPEYVPLSQEELENQYVNTRRTIKALKDESSEYVQLIETKDDLSELSKRQKFLICKSILSSPIYKEEGLKLIINVSIYSEGSFKFEVKPLEFENQDYIQENLMFTGFICEVSVDGRRGLINLYLTRSYDANKSIYVSKEKNGAIVLDKYFRNVPILMNAHNPATTEEPYFKNINK